MFEGLALQKLHDEEGSAIVLANVVDGADVGVIQSRSGTASRRKRSRASGSLASSSGRNFSATKRPRRGVLGLINDAHSAAADFLDDAVMRDGLADHFG